MAWITSTRGRSAASLLLVFGLVLSGLAGCAGRAGGGETEEGEHYPIVTIRSPHDGDSSIEGEVLTFAGEATDAEDGAIPSSSLNWSSDRDGPLGTGTVIARTDLSVGEHTITLAVTDSSNLTTRATIRITVDKDHIAELLNSMIEIPAGSFTMGSDDLALPNSQPSHAVTVRGFRISRFEVTQAQWDRVMSRSGFSFPSPNRGANTGNHPVDSITKADIEYFLYYLNWVTGRSFRLPSEAEWEYACRAGTVTRYSFGDDGNLIFDYGWMLLNSGGRSHAVGGKLPNTWGLYDCHGNVAELVADGWHDDYNGAPLDGSAWASGSPDAVIRGGHYDDPVPAHYESAARQPWPRADAVPTIGFRIAEDVTGPNAHGPVASIARPADGATFGLGQPVSFSGTATDVEDGTLPEAALVWTSDRVGRIGTGSSFARGDLPAGVHQIVLQATDSGGLATAASVRITILEADPGDAITEFLGALVDIPAGSFMMGSTDGPYELAIRTQPVHQVTLARFRISRHEVTQALWDQVVGFAVPNPSAHRSAGSGRYPVESATFDEVETFLYWLRQRTGRNFVLPTEAQWEYACRAGTTTRYSFGDDDARLTDHAWTAADASDATHEVGGKLPNAWGLYDCHGNVSEVVADAWHFDYTGAPSDGSAWERGYGELIRGGSFLDSSTWTLSSAGRTFRGFSGRDRYVGFRVVEIP